MIKQTIQYDDLDGNLITEDFYFNITRLEAMELEIKFPEGLKAHIEKIGKTTNSQEVYYLFKDVVVAAYGVKAEDNKRFIKSEEITSRFADSDALGSLIFKFIEHAESGAQFLEGCLPARLVNQAREDAIAKGAKPGATLQETYESIPGNDIRPTIQSDSDLTPGEPTLADDSIVVGETVGEITNETQKEKSERFKKVSADAILGFTEEQLNDFEDTLKTRNMSREQMNAVYKRREQLR